MPPSEPIDPSEPPADDAPAWPRAVERLARLLLDGGDESVARAELGALMPTLDDADPAQRLALGRCHAWVGALALRRGEHLAAMQAFAAAVVRFDAQALPYPHVHARTQLAAAMSSLGLHAEGLGVAAQAASFGLAFGLHAEAAQALMVVGLCAGLLGDPFLGERYAMEALGIGLAEGLESQVRWCTTNLVYLMTSLAERHLADGEVAAADAVLMRAARHVRRGERLAYPPGSFEHVLFRSNRAAWLALRGQADEASAEYDEVLRAAREQRWLEIERHAAFGLGRLAARRGDAAGAAAALRACVDAGTAHDAYRIVERAHGLLAEAAQARGDAGTAQRHRVAARLMQRQAEMRRQQAAQALRGLDEGLLVALSDADQHRLDSALLRLRETLPFPSTSTFD
jgi:hypothetical protein